MSTTTIPYPATPTVVAPVIERDGVPIHCPDDQGRDAPQYRQISSVSEPHSGSRRALGDWDGNVQILQRVAWWADTGWLLYRPSVTWYLLTITDWRHYHLTSAVETTDLTVRATHLDTARDLASVSREQPCVPTPDDLRQFDTYLIQNPIAHERPGTEVYV